MGVDLSYSKSGVAILEVKNGVPTIESAYLIVSDKKKESHERIDDTVTEIKLSASRCSPSAIAKESSIIRQVSSATPVIKTHAVFEHELTDKYYLDDVSNSTVKAWARTVTGSDGKRKDKEMVAEAVLAYYGNGLRDKLYTSRGKLLDDVADAIALMTLWLEKEGIIPVKYKREKVR